jgi:Carboxypeptidase regulatory-like domain
MAGSPPNVPEKRWRRLFRSQPLARCLQNDGRLSSQGLEGEFGGRIRMSIPSRTNRPNPTLVAVLVTVLLVAAHAADPAQTGKSAASGQQTASAPAAILRGRMTNEAGAPLADVRVRVAIPAVNRPLFPPSKDHKQPEARSDANGEYRLELPGITQRTTISMDAMKPGYRKSSRRDGSSVVVGPGATAEVSLTLVPALYFTGIVVDEHGMPISEVKIAATSRISRRSFIVERTASNSDGSFELFEYPVNPRIGEEVSKGVVSFVHPDYLARRLDDVYAVAPLERKALRIVLETGHKLTGMVFDDAGKPVANAMIKAIRRDGTGRKATITDANGKFALRGLSGGLTMLDARALEIRQKINLPMALNSDQTDLEVRLRPISLPRDLKKYTVLGMQLADVTPELKSAYDIQQERGAVILDPGQDSDRLQIGRIAEGYCFIMVGNKLIGSVRDFINQIFAETAGKDLDLYSVRVVYSLSSVDFDGTTTTQLKITNEDLFYLRLVLDQLSRESR